MRSVNNDLLVILQLIRLVCAGWCKGLAFPGFGGEGLCRLNQTTMEQDATGANVTITL